ncbi:hypothetical protein VTJ83DRAFT_7022 [Remersonia thermophila]|uniref:GPI inositol-deacylase n=1 Tax=Remersonia thermophila TaxID=72144 RepID=A0ABR4D4N5_9PEZI
MSPVRPVDLRISNSGTSFHNPNMFRKKFLRRKPARPLESSGPPAPHLASTSISSDDAFGPMGLTLLHAPVDEPLIDFIFVHSLGGGSRKAWSKTSSLDHFWPQKWLPHEPWCERVRIHTYGYSSDWTKRKADVCNIHDFGKGLLAALSTSLELSTTKTTIVLVGHSMGGLVIKKAYILARENIAYQSLASRIHTIYFLATPHRGSDSAEVLNNVLSIAGLSHAYIPDLKRGSLSNQIINDTFRQYVNDIRIVSFYETRETAIGPLFRALVVPYESAVLGYNTEMQVPMDADHRSICKFESRNDPNYRSLAVNFGYTVGSILEYLHHSKKEEREQQLHALQTYLSISNTPEDDLLSFRDPHIPGTCHWFTSSDRFSRWENISAGSPTILWVCGQPGGGKSVLAGHIIDRLQRNTEPCSYFFFKGGNNLKAEFGTCLRSLAYQMALHDSEILDALLSMCQEPVWTDKDDVRSLWRRLFERGIISGRPSNQRHYWVIDAIDECASDSSSIAFVIDKLRDSTGLRVFITSRESSEIRTYLRALPTQDGQVDCIQLSPSDTLLDIHSLIQRKMEKWGIGEEKDRAALAAKILEKSNGSFLWTSLVLERMAFVYGSEQLSEVLDETPPEMEALYHNILSSMSRILVGKDLAKAILAWATCSIRPLTTDELSEALHLDMKAKLENLRGNISTLCGQLVCIDANGQVRMVHETAREFLLGKLGTGLESEFAVDSMAAHTRIACACLGALTDRRMRPPRTTRRTTELHITGFLHYACEAFWDHLALSNVSSGDLRNLVRKFLKANILTWIEVVAQRQDLSALTRASKNLEAYLSASHMVRSPLSDEDQVMHSWAADLTHIAAKFSDALAACPDAIHWVLPPFWPTNSAIYKAASPGRRFTIRGFSYRQWDDRLVSLNYYRDQTITAICHGNDLFAVAFRTGIITLYTASACQEYLVLKHEEPVQHVEFDSTTSLLASAGRKHLRLWDVSTGKQVHTFDLALPLMRIAFDGNKLLAPTHARHIAAWDLESGSPLPDSPWRDSTSENGRQGPIPCAVSISPGHRMMAVAYQGPPITLWDMDEASFYGRCGKGSLDSMTGPYLAYDLLLNPNEDIPRLAVAYADGDIMLLEPFRNEVVACFQANCHTLASTPDGRLLASADCCGTIQVYDFEALHIVYRIKSAECNIKGLAFSGDGLRLLDIRNTQCNVWEPVALLKRLRMDRTTIEISPTSGSNEVVTDDHSVNITALFIHPRGKFAVCGKEDGSVVLYNVNTAEAVRTLYKSPCFVRMLAWREEGQTLVCVNGANAVKAWRLNKPSDDDDWNIEQTLIDTYVDCRTALTRIHIHRGSPKFVMSSRGADFCWNIDTQQEEARLTAERCGMLRAWTDHPISPDHLICFDGAVARIFACRDWSQTTAVAIPTTCGFGRPELHIKDIYPCPDGRLLIEFADHEGHQETRDMVLVDPSLYTPAAPAMEAQEDEKHPTLTDEQAPPLDDGEGMSLGQLLTAEAPLLVTYDELLERVVHVIGVDSDRFIFVDVDSWVCSAKLAPTVADKLDLYTWVSSRFTADFAREFGYPARSKAVTDGVREALSNAAATCYRHFWVPRNWFQQNSRVLGGYVQSALYPEEGCGGAVVFVRHDRVVVAKNALDFAHWVPPGLDNGLWKREWVVRGK